MGLENRDLKKANNYMEVDIYDTDGNGFVDFADMCSILTDMDSGESIAAANVINQLKEMNRNIEILNEKLQNKDTILIDKNSRLNNLMFAIILQNMKNERIDFGKNIYVEAFLNEENVKVIGGEVKDGKAYIDDENYIKLIGAYFE